MPQNSRIGKFMHAGTFSAGYDKVSTMKDQALIPIRRRYVLNFDPESGRFNIQGILRNCIDSYLKWANVPAVRKRYCKVFSMVMKAACEEMGTVEYASALTKFSAEQPNIQKLLTEVLLCEEDTYRYFIEVAGSCSLLLERFFSKESEGFYKGCLQLAKTYGNTLDLASVNIAFGSLYTNVRGEFTEGESHYRQAMDDLKSLGDCKELALANQRMGWSLYRQGRNSESLSFLEAARKMIKSLGLENGSLTVTNLTSLGVVNNAIGNFERAKNFHFKTLQLRRKKQGECHPGVGVSYNNIGLIYSEMGNPEQALAYFKKGLEVKIKSQAILKSVVYSMNNVVNQLCSLKKFQDAEAMIQDALQKLLHDANPSKDALGLTYDTLGKVYLAQMKFAEAGDVLEKAVEIRQRIMSNGIIFAESLLHLAQAKFGANHLGSARILIERVLEIDARCIEAMPQNTIILESLELLGSIYKAQRNNDKMIEVFERQRNELTRLLVFYDAKKCLSKLDDIQRKLDECLRVLNMLKCNSQVGNIGKMSFKDQIRNTETIISDVVKTYEFVTKTTHDIEDKNDLSKQDENPSQVFTRANECESTQSNTKTFTSNRKAKSTDFFDNFCRHWNYNRNQDSAPKPTETKFVHNKWSTYENSDVNTSFCSECGRNSFTDNTCIEIEHRFSDNASIEAEQHAINEENKAVENSVGDGCVITDDNESENIDTNIPDLLSLLDDESGQTDNDLKIIKVESCSRNNLDTEAKETPRVCLCAHCLERPEACRNTS